MTDGVAPAVAARRIVDEGIALHRSGQIDRAEERYNSALRLDPRQAGALHLLGLIAHQRDDHGAGLALIDRAIAIDGTVAAFHCNRGVVL